MQDSCRREIDDELNKKCSPIWQGESRIAEMKRCLKGLPMPKEGPNGERVVRAVPLHGANHLEIYMQMWKRNVKEARHMLEEIERRHMEKMEMIIEKRLRMDLGTMPVVSRSQLKLSDKMRTVENICKQCHHPLSSNDKGLQCSQIRMALS